MDLPRGDRVRVSSEGVARRSETARKTKREPHKAALSAVCPSTVGLRIDIPEGEGQDVGARRLLDVQHDIRVRERREAYCPVPVRAFGLRARRCRWRNVRREGDLAVVRRDRLCWARHVLRNTGLTRCNVSTVVHTLIRSCHRVGRQERGSRTVPQSGRLPAAGQTRANGLCARGSADEVGTLGEGCQREPDDQEQREQQSNTVL